MKNISFLLAMAILWLLAASNSKGIIKNYDPELKITELSDPGDTIRSTSGRKLIDALIAAEAVDYAVNGHRIKDDGVTMTQRTNLNSFKFFLMSASRMKKITRIPQILCCGICFFNILSVKSLNPRNP